MQGDIKDAIQYLSKEDITYSVPFDLIGEQVDIRLTSTMVEAFYHGGRVASHVRKMNPQQRDPICIREHMPLNHQKYLSYNPAEFVRWPRISAHLHLQLLITSCIPKRNRSRVINTV